MTPLQQRDIHLFDLDNTLYLPKYKILEQIAERMRLFLMTSLSISLSEADHLCNKYFELYGGSIRGLQLHHKNIDLQEFSAYSHDVDLSHVKPDEKLLQALSNCSKQRYVFTNSPKPYASKLIKHLGLEPYFQGLFSVEHTGYKMKPDPHAFEQICRHFEFSANDAVMYDDQLKNLTTAQQLGMRTVLVNRDDLRNTTACYQTEQLPEFINKLNM